jgi:hypothetical protein
MSKPKTTAQNLESRFAAGEDVLDYRGRMPQGVLPKLQGGLSSLPVAKFSNFAGQS